MQRRSRMISDLRSQSPGSLAKHELLDLAGRGFRQRTEDDRARRLEVREMLATPGDQLELGDARRVRLEQHERTRRLAPLLVRPGDNRGLHYLRMTVKEFLDFQPADVFAARVKVVLGPVLDSAYMAL